MTFAEIEALKHDLARISETNSELATEIERLRAAIQDYLDGNYISARSYRQTHKPCPHDKNYYEECGQCIDEHFEKALAEVKP